MHTKKINPRKHTTCRKTSRRQTDVSTSSCTSAQHQHTSNRMFQYPHGSFNIKLQSYTNNTQTSNKTLNREHTHTRNCKINAKIRHKEIILPSKRNGIDGRTENGMHIWRCTYMKMHYASYILLPPFSHKFWQTNQKTPHTLVITF